jgi:uncharacterized protein (DUF1499 family)
MTARSRRVLGVALLAAGCAHPTARTLGAADGKLAPCPRSPNCVSSQADASDKTHFIAPIEFTGSAAAAMKRAKSAIEQIPRATVVENSDEYLRAEFSSRLFKFVDDLELLPDESRHVIDVRSASRTGHGDLGVNRKRVEALRKALAESR